MDSYLEESASFSWRRAQQSTTDVIGERLETMNDGTLASPNMVLLTKLVRIMVMRDVTEFNFDPDRRVILGEGATYQVSKTTARSFWKELHGEKKNYTAAVKIAKLRVGRSLTEIGTSEAEHRRLKVILFELDVLSRPNIREHPNIASLMGFSWDETDFGYAPCLVVELATKGTARDFTSSRTLSDVEKLILCRDVACGLHFLHSNSIVHGDVKQDNILIYEDESAAAGFVAKVSDLERSPQNMEPQTYTGTTLYNAPEVRVPGQNSAEKDALWLCDVFSFGLLAFEVLSGLMFKQVSNSPEHHEHQRGMNKTLNITLQSVKTTWKFSEDLRHICHYILKHTLADDPSERIPLGWSMVLNILPYNNDGNLIQNKDVVGVTHDNITYSVLEIHAKVRGIFKERLGDAMWFDLDYTAKNAKDPHQRGNAAFNLFLLYSLGRFGPYKNVQDALVLLSDAAKCQYVPAFVVGMRIYKATGLATHLPDIFQKGPELTKAHEAVSKLYGLPSDEFYSSAVQIFWTAKLERDLTNRLNALFDHHGFEPTSNIASKIQYEKRRMTEDEFSAYANTSYLLHHCVANREYLACETLLQAKCDINARIPGGMTALHLACQCANSEIIKLLLQYNADPTINDERNISPLHWLVLLPKDDIREIAESLIAKCGDAKIDVASTKSRAPMFFDDLGLWLEGTPMQWAVDCYNFTAIQIMLELGFIPFLDKRWPQGYLHQALGNACAKSAKLFMELRHCYSEEDIEDMFKYLGSRGSDLSRWLMHGESNHDVYGEIIDLLGVFGFRLPLTTNDMIQTTLLTPLCTAVISYHIPLIRELLKRGANINERSVLHSALGWAFASSDATGPKHKVTDTIKLLLYHGATTSPEPPLHMACSFFVDDEIIRLLVNQNPQSVNLLYHGTTPLIYLLSLDIKDDLLGKVQALADAPGANLDIESPHSGGEAECCYTALAYCLVNFELKAANYLLEKKVKLELGVRGGHQHTVLHLLIQHAFNIKRKQNGVGLSMLLGTLNNLLRHKESKNLINIRDHNNISPLNMAVRYALPHVVEILLKKEYKIHRGIVEEEYNLLLQEGLGSGTSDTGCPGEELVNIMEMLGAYLSK